MHGAFSHTPDAAAAGASGAVLVTALVACEGIALAAFIVLLLAADTPTEVLARATAAGIVRSTSAGVLTGLFRRARYSAEPMTPADSAAAAAVLAQLRANLADADVGAGR